MLRFAFCHGSWIPTSAAFIDALSCLSKNEQDIAMRFTFQRDVLSSIVGKLLVRRIGVHTLNVPCSDIHIDFDTNGRPFYRNFFNQLDFNLSHNGDFTVCVATHLLGRCGVDVMRLDLPPNGQKVAVYVNKLKNIFTPLELNTILFSNKCDDELVQLKWFYRHWCFKESFVKALGCGLRVALPSIECHFGDNSELFIESELGKDKHWHFEEHLLPNDHLVTVAHYMDPDQKMQNLTVEPFLILDFDHLMDKMSITCPASANQWEEFVKKPKSPIVSSSRYQK